jgi:type III restriction enzyme
MKLQFKVQRFQTDAVAAVADCFAGQPRDDGLSFRIAPGAPGGQVELELIGAGLRNAEIELDPGQLLANLTAVQREQGLPESSSLAVSPAAAAGAPNLDVEMETGTGKTYVYIKTIMELNKRYGWSKFIVVVPSVAIREGVKKSFDVTAEHFQEAYGTTPRAFVYDSARLHELERFSSDSGIQVMIINVQAFNSKSAANRRIYGTKRIDPDGDEVMVGLDDFGSRKPIDVIASSRPIVIIDEPQKLGGTAKKPSKSLAALADFNALMVLRYSATHRIDHDKVYRLDAIDAYNQKLVKKIAVRGITVRGLAGTAAYLYLEGIEIAGDAKPRARVEIEVRTKAGPIKRMVKTVDRGTDLHRLSGGIEAYADLYVTEIDARRDVIELSNGDVVTAGQLACPDVTEVAKRRIQIREVIRAHLDKERELFARGIKVLSLLFIDEVAKYRDYEAEDDLGEYARVFEEEYSRCVEEVLAEPELDGGLAGYKEYLRRSAARDVHEGYFAVDKRTQRLVDPAVGSTGTEAGVSADADAYDLILKDKERLLSLDEPVRFVFSHSALREGWDNPNVFVIGMLKKSDNVVSRRQEIGRGLRLSVDQLGERTDSPTTVHEINELTVVTDESYTDFVAGLQTEIGESLAGRPRKASVKYFTGKRFRVDEVEETVSEELANALYRYLIRNDYLDEDDTISDTYKAHREAGTMAESSAEALAETLEPLLPLVDALLLDLPLPEDGRKPKRIPLNAENFAKAEFQELWNRINRKAVYRVDFDSEELVARCISALDAELKVTQLQYVVQSGKQLESLEVEDLQSATAFEAGTTSTFSEEVAPGSQVSYDLVGEIAEMTSLTRRTAAAILAGLSARVFAKYRQNPEQFITECARLVNEQKAAITVENLTYDTLEERYDASIFTDNQTKQDFARAGNKLEKHVYDYVVTDSEVERDFVTELDLSSEVAVYAKLPRGFVIPTPVGDYNPDWAIAFKSGAVKYLHFVAETKGSLSSLQLRAVEQARIASARKFFERLNETEDEPVAYDIVTDYAQLMQLVN